MFKKLVSAFFGLAMMGMAGTAHATLIDYTFTGFGFGSIDSTIFFRCGLYYLSMGRYRSYS